MSALPTAGGFAGYFRAGTTINANNAAIAISIAVLRGVNTPKRLSAKAKAIANKPPMAAPYTSTPVKRPEPAWTARLTSSGSAAIPAAALCCSSMAIAWSTHGSP
ncbi:hypothetical protein D9M72_580580 [compost metagenome]